MLVQITSSKIPKDFSILLKIIHINRCTMTPSKWLKIGNFKIDCEIKKFIIKSYRQLINSWGIEYIT